ncbi:hypothetical protein BJX63DRAFT_431391 [Aspergillus granulosus]|uniref:Uncharacterized protein n=1 Tax=Aspergillus granulosus TaxID=176169 RepID=A0ABR4HG75_9EURO
MMPRGITAMLTQELQRLGRELSVSDELSVCEESEGEGATQVNQLNIVLSFVTLARKPLTVEQLELILEIIFEEEVLNLEDDLRTLYSSLFLLRPHQRDYYADTNIVEPSAFRTGWSQGESRPSQFLYVLFYASREVWMPTSNKSTGALRDYAEIFLPTHLKEARPNNAGKLHEKISALIDDLFSKEECRYWLIDNTFRRSPAQYSFYPTSFVTDVGYFWLDGTDREIVNQRAEMTMQWLLPETKQAFDENAQASAIASDVCPFTVLFSYMADYCLRLWLEPQGIKTSDGSLLSSQASSMRRTKEVSFINAIAELSRHERMALWNARVGQALLLNGHPAAARGHFRTALDEQKKTPTLDPVSLSVLHRDLGRSCTEIARYAEHHELFMSLVPDEEHPDNVLGGRTSRLLNSARLEHRVRRTKDALATMNEAWESLAEQDGWWYIDFEIFFRIFLDLHHPQGICPVFDRAATFYDVEDTVHLVYKDFAHFLIKYIYRASRMSYQVLQYVLSPDDGDYLDLVAFIMEQMDALEWRSNGIPEYKYLVANILFTKGRVDVGLDGWCQVITDTGDEKRSNLSIKYSHARARAWTWDSTFLQA